MLDAKDEYTAMHSRNVSNISKSIAQALDLPAEQIWDIEIAAYLHDIGKVSIPYNIINKNGALDDEEFKTIKKHPSNSYIILQRLSGFFDVKDYVLYHHERFDGKGYPEGKKGNEIPLGARIISLADTYDAMTSSRSYRKALSHETAMAEIKANAGTQFDPRLAEIFIDLDFCHNEDHSIEEKKNKNFIERKLFESEEVISQQKDEFMENVEEANVFNKIVSDESFAEKIFNNTPVSYILLKPDYEVVYASPHFLSNFNLGQRQAQGKKCFEMSGGNQKCVGCPMSKAVEENRLVQEELIQNINGIKKYFDCYSMPYHNDNGELIYILEILLDRTEERQLRKEHENDLANIVAMLLDLLAINDLAAFNKSKFIKRISGRILEYFLPSPQEMQEIEMAGALCDVAMISLSDIDMDEEQKYKTHTMLAYDMLSGLSAFENIADIIKHHHELYNGHGFPDGLSGNQIPLASRIISLADACYEYLIKYPEKGLEEMLDQQEVMAEFDPKLIKILKEELQFGPIKI